MHLIRVGRELPADEGVVEFAASTGWPGDRQELREARPVGAEQSNTSIVFDEELILKVFRRLEAGINPELELLRFLTEHGFENIAQLAGWYAYSGGADGRDARHPAAVRRGRARRLGARARRDL